MNEPRFDEKNVLIIGSSSITGGEISTLFRKASMRVITTYSSTKPKDFDGQSDVDALHLDLRDDENIENFSQRLKKISSTIDIAIFLSGVLPGKRLDNYEFSEIDEVMAINFNGQAKLISKILPLFNENSRLLLFSSISAQRGSFDPVYAASKGALLSLVKSLIFELPLGARINSIAPGLIQDSTMFQDMTLERQQYHKNQIPSRRLLQQKDLAKIVFDLCQDHWRHLNGACIDLNGGQYVR
jgi:3-oxoacyl-[acyl-carrier protein] reductase